MEPDMLRMETMFFTGSLYKNMCFKLKYNEPKFSGEPKRNIGKVFRNKYSEDSLRFEIIFYDSFD